MKLSIYISIIFLLSISNLNAQQFYAGVKAGVATTQISGDQLGGFDKVGVDAGAFVGLELSEKFDMVMEILYVQKGSRKNADPENSDFVSYLLRLNYIEIPLAVQWKFSKRFTFEAGPAFGVLMSSLEEDEYGRIEDSDDLPRDFNKTEFSLFGGLTVGIIKDLAFNVRYQKSVLPVRDHVSGATYRFNKGQYNEVLAFTFQYTFGKNKE